MTLHAIVKLKEDVCGDDRGDRLPAFCLQTIDPSVFPAGALLLLSSMLCCNWLFDVGRSSSVHINGWAVPQCHLITVSPDHEA
jgi:hypothetical protein